MDETQKLEQAIAALEGQRDVLGDAVVDTALAPLKEKLASLPPVAEQRKLVTVLFSDLASFTAMSESMDPEDVREILNDYFQCWANCIERRAGKVEKFIGDAVMAVFGLETAREDDLENAIRAALDMRQELETLNHELQRSHGLRLEMRVGIHTGPVVVSFLGERKGQDFVVVGDAVNLTSRLQAAAPLGGILISHDTYRHVRGIFNVQPLDPLTVKGKRQPVQAYLVLGAKPRAFRLSTRGVEGIETRLVGRQAELKRLQDLLLATISDSRCRAAMLVGEAGLGKSRLMYEFDDWLEMIPHEIFYFKGRASPSMQSAAYSLLRDLFSFRFQIMESDPPSVVQEKWKRGLAEAGDLPPNQTPDVAQRACEIGGLLGFELGAPAGSPCPDLAGQDARQLRDRALAYLSDYFQALADRSPLVLLLEDIHWADDSSLDVIERLVPELARRPVMLVCTGRPSLLERRPAWGTGQALSKALYARLDLGPLSREYSRDLVADILQKVEHLPEALVETVVNSAEGNPFYIEELIKMFIEDGVILKDEDRWQVEPDRLAQARIPATLVEVLTARFDSLSPEERLALQRAAIIGRIFWDEALEKLDDTPLPGSLPLALGRLQSREMVNKRPNSTFENTQEYAFKHALLRDVTYESVLKRVRKVYHAHAARWLEQVTQRSQRADEYADLIAGHYHQAQEHAQAAQWYKRAGLRASAHYANPEAVRCLSHCLELTPAEDVSERYELLLEREKVYNRQGDRQAQADDLLALEELAAKLGAAQQTEVALRRAAFAHYTGDYPLGVTHVQQAIALARRTGDVAAQAKGYNLWGISLWRQGDLTGAQQKHEQALALVQEAGLAEIEADALRGLGVVAEMQSDYGPAREYLERSLALFRQVGNQRGVSMCLNSLGVIAYHTGDYAAAHSYWEQALRFKRESGERYEEGVTLTNLGIVARSQGNLDAAQDYFTQCLRLCQAIDDPEGEAAALGGLGSAVLYVGDYASAQRYFEQALRLSHQIGDLQGAADALSGLGLVSQQQGRYAEAREYCLQALEVAEKMGGRSEQAYALLTLGDALLGLGSLGEAKTAFQRSLAIRQELGQELLMLDSLAGAARGAMAAGDLAQAQRYVQQIMDLGLTVQASGSTLIDKADDPHLVYLTCVRLFLHNQDVRASEMLAHAHRLLMEQVGKIEDVARRRAFLEQVPHRRELVAAYQGLKGQPS